jgi:hypothetical protein
MFVAGARGGTTMNQLTAHVGDRLIIKAHRVGEHDRDGEILEVRGDEGHPPYLVRWDDTGRVGLLFPGSDAAVQHLVHED